jgi:DNA-binding response OmpR family regulator/HPt (histidine-containing phosphotransfer) domain-containing protein
MNKPSFEDSLNRIKARFVQKIKDRLSIFEDFLYHVRKDTISNNELDKVRTQMHKIAGSARTFGFSELSGHAAYVENYLDQLVDGTPLSSISEELMNAFEVFLKECHFVVGSDLGVISEVSVVEKEEEVVDCEYDVLIADDDELVRDLLKNGLKDKCKLSQAGDGQEALDIIDKIKADPNLKMPDLVVLDVNMPRMTGFEVLQILKKSRDTDSIPVIMLTRRDEDESVIQGISYGALDYIIKPFEISELVNRILGALQQQKIKILIADDDELIRELLYHRFHRMGYQVIVAENGQEALDCINKEKPDISIMDIMMPAMDGISVLKLVRSDPELSNLAIILLTAKSQQENILEGLSSGANDYITKPFDVDEITARVSGILQRRKIV